MRMNPTSTSPASVSALTDVRLAFIGGGNMASAIIGGLIRQGVPGHRIDVVEPNPSTRDALRSQYGVGVHAEATAALAHAHLVVWAVKPQTFRAAADAAGPHTRDALHLSVAAGIRTDSLTQWLATERIVRAMPNTPALVGAGMTGLFARPSVTAEERDRVAAVMAATGQLLWLDKEQDLDAVTALSGSGPAYVFYFLEAMRRAGTEMGLAPEAALQLAIGTFAGASKLAADADVPPEILRERVTSKGGTTYAALTALETAGVGDAFVRAMHAACHRATELGDEFGR